MTVKKYFKIIEYHYKIDLPDSYKYAFKKIKKLAKKITKELLDLIWTIISIVIIFPLAHIILLPVIPFLVEYDEKISKKNRLRALAEIELRN